MATPSIKGVTSNTGAGVTSLTLTKPTGGGAPATGDLLLLICCDDSNGNGEGMTAITSETGWTQEYNHGSASSDAYVALYWRIADGTEDATVVVPSHGTEDMLGWYVVVENADETTPIDVEGTWGISVSGTDTLVAVTVSANDCLAIAHWAFDGGDGETFTLSGTGWATTPEYAATANSGPAGASGGWRSKAVSASSSSEDVAVSGNASDQISGLQFAIRGGDALAYSETFSQSVTSSASATEAVDFSEGFVASAASSVATAETYDAPDYVETLAQSVASSVAAAETYALEYAELLAQSVASSAVTAETYDAPDYIETLAQSVTASQVLAETYDPGVESFEETLAQSVTSSAAMVEAVDFSEALAQSVTATAAAAETYDAPDYTETLSQSVTAGQVLAETYDPNYQETISASVASSVKTIDVSGDGDLFTVVFASALGTPTNTQIFNGLDATGADAAFADQEPATTTNPYTFSATGLTSSTSYQAAFVWFDGTDFSNVVETAAFVTLADNAYQETLAQSVSSSAAMAETYQLAVAYEETLAQAVTSSAALAETYDPKYQETLAASVASSVNVIDVSGDGDLFTVVYSSALGTPTDTQIFNGLDAAGAAAVFADQQPATASNPYTFSATGLASSTSYQAAFVWFDGTDFSNVVETGAFVTLADNDFIETLPASVTSSAAAAEAYQPPGYNEALSQSVTSSAVTAETYEFGQNYQETLNQSVTSSAAIVEVYSAPDYLETLAQAVASSALMAETVDFRETLAESVTSTATTAEQFGYLETLAESVASAAAMAETYGAPDYLELLSEAVASGESFTHQFTTPNVLPALGDLTAAALPGYGGELLPGYLAHLEKSGSGYTGKSIPGYRAKALPGYSATKRIN